MDLDATVTVVQQVYNLYRVEYTIDNVVNNIRSN